MKAKILLLAAGLSMGTFGAYAQKGVDNGTKFGSGEDSIRCITNISLFIPYAKAGSFADALGPWEVAYNECPAATKDIYLYGVRIKGWQIAQEKDAAKRAILLDELMAVYDKRVKYFGNDKRYGKDWIISRKAQNYIQVAREKADHKKTYGWLKEIMDEFGVECEALGASLFMFASNSMLRLDPNFKEQYIADYLQTSALLDDQMGEATATNDKKTIEMLASFKSSVDNGFATSGAADCETLQNMYASKVEENKENIEFLEKTVALLRKVRCQEIDAYFAASGYLYQKEKTADAAIGLGKQALKNNDTETAMKYFEEAAAMEEDPLVKSDLFYMMAVIIQDKKEYSKARQYCRKAIEANPNSGSPYILIGQMYAATANSVSKDPILKRTAYYAAVDKLVRAVSVDPECAEEANNLISIYRKHFPSVEEVFMHPELDKGKGYTVGGWIGERVTVR